MNWPGSWLWCQRIGERCRFFVVVPLIATLCFFLITVRFVAVKLRHAAFVTNPPLITISSWFWTGRPRFQFGHWDCGAVVGFVLLVTNPLVHRLLGWAVNDAWQSAIQTMPFALGLFLIILVADLLQYWTHRA